MEPLALDRNSFKHPMEALERNAFSDNRGYKQAGACEFSEYLSI